jgi:hypothetical protein
MIVNSLYIDPDFIAVEYLQRCCQKKWKKSNDEEALKCLNLELALEAELENKPSVLKMLTMNDISGEEI